VQMQSFPFRMTAENMAKHRLDPNIGFWRELKKGADEFEVTKLQTPVGVCNKHYVFASAKNGERFDAESACPPLDLDQEVVRAVNDKQARDDSEIQGLVAKGVKPIRIVYQDGGQNPAFSHRFAEVSRPDAIAAPPTEIVLDDSPRARPVAVQIAAAKEAATAAALVDGLPKTPPSVSFAAKGAPPVAAAPKGAKPVVTASIKARKPVDAGRSEPAAATFTSAPSAYAKEEPKSATRSFFDRVMNLGGGESSPPDTAPDGQASLSGKPAGLDPGFVAMAPSKN